MQRIETILFPGREHDNIWTVMPTASLCNPNCWRDNHQFPFFYDDEDLPGNSLGCSGCIRDKQVLINCSVALYLSCRRWKRKVLRQWDNDGSEIQQTKAVLCACRTQDKVYFDSNIKFRGWECHVPNTTSFHRKFWPRWFCGAYHHLIAAGRCVINVLRDSFHPFHPFLYVLCRVL